MLYVVPAFMKPACVRVRFSLRLADIPLIAIHESDVLSTIIFELLSWYRHKSSDGILMACRPLWLLGIEAILQLFQIHCSCMIGWFFFWFGSWFHWPIQFMNRSSYEKSWIFVPAKHLEQTSFSFSQFGYAVMGFWLVWTDCGCTNFFYKYLGRLPWDLILDVFFVSNFVSNVPLALPFYQHAHKCTFLIVLRHHGESDIFTAVVDYFLSSLCENPIMIKVPLVDLSHRSTQTTDRTLLFTVCIEITVTDTEIGVTNDIPLIWSYRLPLNLRRVCRHKTVDCKPSVVCPGSVLTEFLWLCSLLD